MARALSIGQKESAALFALSNDIPAEVVTELEQAVKVRGMTRFLNHDVIGKGTFSTGWSSGSGSAESWSDVLTNLPSDRALATHCNSVFPFRHALGLSPSEVSLKIFFFNKILPDFVAKVRLYLERVIGDYDHAAEGMRKALALNLATKVHQACGIFLFFLTKLESIAPAADFPTMKETLLVQFRSTLMDSDLLHCLETQVPSNADLKACSGFRPGFFLTEIICKAVLVSIQVSLNLRL